MFDRKHGLNKLLNVVTSLVRDNRHLITPSILLDNRSILANLLAYHVMGQADLHVTHEGLNSENKCKTSLTIYRDPPHPCSFLHIKQMFPHDLLSSAKPSVGQMLLNFDNSRQSRIDQTAGIYGIVACPTVIDLSDADINLKHYKKWVELERQIDSPIEQMYEDWKNKFHHHQVLRSFVQLDEFCGLYLGLSIFVIDSEHITQRIALDA